MKNDILATWKSRDRRRTSSLRPTFTSSSAHSKDQGSTLGKTFTSGRAMTSISSPHSPSCSLGETSSPFFKPLAPPPRIPSLSRLFSYIQELLPTSYPTVETPMEYNFDPMTGRSLKPLILSTYSPFGNGGQMLAAKLGETSVGRGQSAPSPPVRRSEQRGRQVDVHTKASLPPPITMHLDP